MSEGRDRVSERHRIWQAAPLAIVIAGLAGCSQEVLVGSLPDGPAASSAACDRSAPPGVSTIASGLDATYTIPTVLRDDTLFFATQAGIMKVPLGGGSPILLSTAPAPYPGQPAPSDIRVDATNVYVSSLEWLVSMPVEGGQTTSLHETDRALSSQFAIDAESVYWVDLWEGDSTAPPGAWVMTMPLGGGEATVLASLPGTAPLPGIYGLAIDAENVYWTYDDRVLTMPKAGGEVTTIASHQLLPSAVALDDENVYWMNDGTTTPPEYGEPLVSGVMGAPKSGGAPTSFGVGDTKTQGYASGVTVNATGVYWIQDTWPSEGSLPQGSRLMRAPLSGGPAEEIATLSTTAAGRPIPCPGGICWAAADRTKSMTVAGSLMRYNACP